MSSTLSWVGEGQQRDGNVSSSNCEKHYTLCMCVFLCVYHQKKRKKRKENRLMVVLFGILFKCTMAIPQCTAKMQAITIRLKVICYTFSLVSYVKSALAAVRDPCVKDVYHD